MILIFVIVIIAGFLVWYSQRNINGSQNRLIIPKKVYQIYLADNIKNLVQNNIEDFFTSKNKGFNFVDQVNLADIVILDEKNPDKENIEIGSYFEPNFTQITYNQWQAKEIKINLIVDRNNSFYNKLTENLKENLNKPDFTLVATGDIMLARHVGKKMIEANNWNLPFLKVASLLKSGDLTISNLESPFAQGGQKSFEGMVFGADPKSISGLNYAGIDIVTLANNHFGNQGKSGMTYTFNLLTQNNIAYVGAGNNFIESHNAKILESNSLKIAFLGYDGVDSTPTSYIADANSAGLSRMNNEQVKKDIKKAKDQNPNLIIVSMHAGNEYIYYPRQDQKDFAHIAVDSGADLVIGHHPHCIQIFEKYNNKFIFYSLGNLVFDQMWSEKTKEGMILKITFNGQSIKSFSLIPIYITNYNQPQLTSDSQGEEILNNILPKSNF